MDTVKYPDAGHSGSSRASTSLESSSATNIEMDTLEDPPDHQLHHHKHESVHESDPDSEDDSEGDDEGDRALLTPRDRPRGWERSRSRSPGPKTRIWKQVQRIVIEVFLPARDMAHPSAHGKYSTSRQALHYC